MKGLNWKVTMLFLVAMALCVPAAHAQQKDPRLTAPAQPVPPIGAEESSSRDSGGTAAAAAPASAPVKAPLGGAQEWVPEGASSGINFLVPSLNVQFGGDSNSLGGNSRLASFVTVGGGLAWQRVWRTSQLTTQYTGGGSFYSSASYPNRSYQDLRVSYQKAFRQWSLMFADSINYSPEGRGGGGQGFGLLGLDQGFSGNQLVNLNQLLVPNNSILTANSGRISNTIVGEVSLTPNARSGLTFSGSYGVLHFVDPGFIDGENLNFRAGYNYTLSARDSLGIVYQHGIFQFSGTSQENSTDTAHFTYGRQLTGRLTWQVAGGPQYTVVNPAIGPTRKLLRWSMSTSLNYHLNRSSMELRYLHATTGGSGFLLGAETDQVQGSYSRQLSRMWRGSFNTSFARNRSLTGFAGSLGGRRFNTWVVGTSLSRPVGRTASMSLTYSLQRQTSQNVNCVGANCAFDGFRHVFGIGFSFRFSPLQLD